MPSPDRSINRGPEAKFGRRRFGVFVGGAIASVLSASIFPRVGRAQTPDQVSSLTPSEASAIAPSEIQTVDPSLVASSPDVVANVNKAELKAPNEPGIPGEVRLYDVPEVGGRIVNPRLVYVEKPDEKRIVIEKGNRFRIIANQEGLTGKTVAVNPATYDEAENVWEPNKGVEVEVNGPEFFMELQRNRDETRLGRVTWEIDSKVVAALYFGQS